MKEGFHLKYRRIFSRGRIPSLLMFEELFRVIAISESKRGGHTMRQSISMPPSVSRWRFFRFQSISKPFSCDFGVKVAILEEFKK